MIKVKISDIINGADVLQKLANKELKARLAWQTAKLLKAADAELTSFNETRMNLIKKYGNKDEAGELITDEKGNCRITEELAANFSSELNELLASDIEINANKIKISDLENFDFTPAEMNTLEPFIDFDE